VRHERRSGQDSDKQRGEGKTGKQRGGSEGLSHERKRNDKNNGEKVALSRNAKVPIRHQSWGACGGRWEKRMC